MSAIFDFAAEYDLSAALTELRVAIRLRDGRGRNEDCSPCPTQINIVSIAAMHTPLPQSVMDRPQSSPSPSLCLHHSRKLPEFSGLLEVDDALDIAEQVEV